MKIHIAQFRRQEGAIRAMDVAAIIAVLFVLGIVGVMGSERLKERALRVKCASNLAQIGKALQVYGASFNGLLPDCSPMNPQFSGGGWPWDVNTNLVSWIQGKGVTQEQFYCPANPDMTDDRHWNYWKGRPNARVRIIGYGMLFNGTGEVPPNFWRVKITGNGKPPAEEELGMDAVVCQNDDYTTVKGVLQEGTSHLRKTVPLGGNILFVDGHVKWRNFDEMSVRFATEYGQVSWSF